jgi:hypothetical protein
MSWLRGLTVDHGDDCLTDAELRGNVHLTHAALQGANLLAYLGTETFRCTLLMTYWLCQSTFQRIAVAIQTISQRGAIHPGFVSPVSQALRAISQPQHAHLGKVSQVLFLKVAQTRRSHVRTRLRRDCASSKGQTQLVFRRLCHGSALAPTGRSAHLCLRRCAAGSAFPAPPVRTDLRFHCCGQRPSAQGRCNLLAGLCAVGDTHASLTHTLSALWRMSSRFTAVGDIVERYLLHFALSNIGNLGLIECVATLIRAKHDERKALGSVLVPRVLQVAVAMPLVAQLIAMLSKATWRILTLSDVQASVSLIAYDIELYNSLRRRSVCLG